MINLDIPVPYILIPVPQNHPLGSSSSALPDETWFSFLEECDDYINRLCESINELSRQLYLSQPKPTGDDLLALRQRYRELHEEHDLITDRPIRGTLYFTNYTDDTYMISHDNYRFSMVYRDGYDDDEEDDEGWFTAVRINLPRWAQAVLPAVISAVEPSNYFTESVENDDTIRFVAGGLVPIFQKYYGFPGPPPHEVSALP